MADDAIAKSVGAGAATGAAAGPFGALFGATAGYVSSSGVLGSLLGVKKSAPPPTPFYETSTFWEFAGVGIAIVVLLVLVVRKKA